MEQAVTLKIELPKVPDIELVAIEGLNRLAHHLGIPDENISEARLLVTEAIINGLEHGGEDNPGVSVEFTMTTRELVVFVRDYGKGFEPSSLEEPDIAKKLASDRKRGWGLKVMRSMSDFFNIESSSAGTKITIKKFLS
jgi:anti-sigma regulatory factor (Ser/Thr protein kinase)